MAQSETLTKNIFEAASIVAVVALFWVTVKTTFVGPPAVNSAELFKDVVNAVETAAA